MAKIADCYFKTDAWSIVEEGFDPEYGTIAESVFALGNEYMGIRGFFEEGYTGKQLIGSYFNGIYERQTLGSSSYKGIVNQTEFMVNSVNWLYTRIRTDKEELDLSTSRFSHFVRKVEFKSGLLTRAFIWETKGGKIKLTFERFLSMHHYETGCQKIRLESIDFTGKITLETGIDFGPVHEVYHQNYWTCTGKNDEADYMMLEGTTISTKQKVCSISEIHLSNCQVEGNKQEEKFVSKCIEINLKCGEAAEVERITKNYVCKSQAEEKDYEVKKQLVRECLKGCQYQTLLEENRQWWENVWKHSDITIEGDIANQQGIRFCIFQLFQTYHGAKEGDNIGAKGLTGEAYNGNAFWDTETYCLPFFIFNNMDGARNLLLFRYHTLQEAKARAKQLDCEGAFYPIATISGRECCNLWQHASLQLQASTAVAYGIWFYEKITQDAQFMLHYGAEMLIEISRMLVTRGDWNSDHSYFGYYGVMGPDEFQVMVNQNCYTNYMARFTLRYALEAIAALKRLATLEATNQEEVNRLFTRLALTQTEQDNWANIAEKIYIPYNEKSKVFEQHDGFFKLPHVDVDAIPTEDFPLYHHWSYDRIYRNDMIKQPDVLMFMLLFYSSFTKEQQKANYEFYEPKCIHESSLSPSVHSILAAALGKKEEAFEFFRFATRMDLDNYNRNSGEGIHTTSISAAWMNIVYGFGGMRSDKAGCLSFAPSIPDSWKSYSFRINVGENTLIFEVHKEYVLVKKEGLQAITVEIYGRKYVMGQEPLNIATQ